MESIKGHRLKERANEARSVRSSSAGLKLEKDESQISRAFNSLV